MDGNYFAETEVLKALEGNGNIAFRYVDAEGKAILLFVMLMRKEI
jgi:phosphoribosylformylglycinamidine (FGAM) synthase-like amidotransferase family enzyme